MKENLKKFNLIDKKNVLIQGFIIVLLVFLLSNKHDANASEYEQNKEANLNEQVTGDSNNVENKIQTQNLPSEKNFKNPLNKVVENSEKKLDEDSIKLEKNTANDEEQTTQQKIENNNISSQYGNGTNVNTMTTNDKVKRNIDNPNKISQNTNNTSNKYSVTSTNTNQTQLINAEENVSSNSEEDRVIKKQKQQNDRKLKNIKGNNSFKNTHLDQQYEGILSIETDRTNYKPGDTVKIYTEYNKSFVKPIYSEALLYSHRSSGWYIDDPPYRFDQTSLVGRTTSFYKKPNGNWESIISIQLPEKMVDDAFDITVNSWNDVQSEYTQSFGGLFNDLLIKVKNDSTASALGGYKVEAFDENTTGKEEYEAPKIIKYTTDKKVYNPNDIVKMTIEMQDQNAITYVQTKLKTLDPDVYKDGSQKYIPMNFVNFTRDMKQLSNGHWQAIIEFKLPSYIKTGDIMLDDIVTSDELGNDNKLNYDKKLFKVERTENVSSFTVDTIADFSKEIRGKATSNMMVYAYVNNKQIGKAKVIDGKYFMSIPKQKAGTSVQIFTINKYNKKSKAIAKKVIDKTAPQIPTASKITTKSKTISGKGEKNSIVYIFKGSKKIGQVKVDSKGNFKLNIKTQKKGDKLTLYAIDSAKNKSKSTFIRVS
ncbi:hypothetical protein HYE69_07965 [Staphylococcus sp. GSSP0090]|nr:hypothetical protein [Staphylococcus sp. GSSP0090]